MDHGAAAATGLFAWLEGGAVGQAMRQSMVLYPLVEILHILGFALLVGAIVTFDLRVLGFGRSIPIQAAARHCLPIAVCGFALAVPMGLLLFVTEATSIVRNPAFLTKMSLLVLAGANLALFHLGPWRRVAGWAAGSAPAVARAGAALSAALWIGVLACGRLIAYF
jgi:hypothetical protein